MFIHHHTCIAPVPTDENFNFENIPVCNEGKILAIEPSLMDVPPAMTRRMSKAVKMGLAAGLPILQNNQVDGIILGTANGGMQDCILFLNQIVDYNEGLLTPANFVQSTPNAIAGQLSMLTQNNHYNATHVHNGLAFENALMDAKLWLQENKNTQYLVGGVDEISSYNYNIDRLAGWFSEKINNNHLFTNSNNATIAGEGAAMFLINDQAENAIASIQDIAILHSDNEEIVASNFKSFLQTNSIQSNDTIIISGFNGNQRQKKYYDACFSILEDKTIVHFKHLTGEYPTSSAFAVWLACQYFQNKNVKNLLVEKNKTLSNIKNIVIYNSYHGNQHSFIYLTKNKNHGKVFNL